MEPPWLDGTPDGPLACPQCCYRCADEQHLASHVRSYHCEAAYCLVLEHSGGAAAQQDLWLRLEQAGWVLLDARAGLLAFEDGDLAQFAQHAIQAAREPLVRRILRLHDPGYGVPLEEGWIRGGLAAGVFQSYTPN